MTRFYLLAELAIYGYFGLWGLAFLIALTVGSYLAGQLISRFRWVFWAFLAFCVGLLALIGFSVSFQVAGRIWTKSGICVQSTARS